MTACMPAVEPSANPLADGPEIELGCHQLDQTSRSMRIYRRALAKVAFVNREPFDHVDSAGVRREHAQCTVTQPSGEVNSLTLVAYRLVDHLPSPRTVPLKFGDQAPSACCRVNLHDAARQRFEVLLQQSS